MAPEDEHNEEQSSGLLYQTVPGNVPRDPRSRWHEGRNIPYVKA